MWDVIAKDMVLSSAALLFLPPNLQTAHHPRQRVARNDNFWRLSGSAASGGGGVEPSPTRVCWRRTYSLQSPA